MRQPAVALVAVLGLLAGSACKPVPGRARMLNGATDAPGSGQNPLSGTPQRLQQSLGGDGDWAITPDKVEVRFRRLAFEDDARNQVWVDLGDCGATFDRAAPTLSARLDCDFQVPPGTYTGIRLGFDRTMRMLVDDAANGFFTDGTGVVRSAPAGGATFTPIESIQDTVRSRMVEPLVVQEGSPVEVNVVLSGVHAVNVQVNGGTATVRQSFGVEPFVTSSAVSGANYYSGATTAGSYNTSAENHPTELMLFFQNPTTPSYAFLKSGQGLSTCAQGNGPFGAYNTGPGVADENGTRLGGFLGQDSAGSICFALPADQSYSRYRALYSMTGVTQLNGTTTLFCQPAESVPVPSSGSYSSGCPQLAAAGQSALRLIAR